MAIYHLSAKIISRGKGKSAIAASAYRSASCIEDNKTGLIYDFSRKRNVAFSEIILPANAPEEFSDRQTLWNSVESIERSKNSQLAREIEFALPSELNFDQRKSLAQAFARTFAENGMCVDLAIHDLPHNPHCHLLLTLRGIDEHGHWLPKCKKVHNSRVDLNDWNKKESLEKWRKLWQDLANDALKKADVSEKIDCRSFKKRGLNQIPTIHLGHAATALERHGILTERGNLNRAISIYNQQLSLTYENERLSSSKKILQNYQDALKELPAPDDFFHFYMWILQARKTVDDKINRLYDKFFDIQSKFFDKIVSKSLEGETVRKAKDNLDSLNLELQKQNKILSDLEWGLAELEKHEPFEQTSTFKFLLHINKVIRQQKDWGDRLTEKKAEIQKVNDLIIALKKKIHTAELNLEIAQKNLQKNRHLIIKNNTSETEPELVLLNDSINALKQDSDFLSQIKENCDAKLQDNPKLKKIISKYLELARGKNSFNIEISHVRNLRLAEQEIKNPNFLENLAQILDNDSSVQLVAISDPEFLHMPIDWDLLSELEKDELLQKKMIRSL